MLFEGLGAELHLLNCEPDGVNINKECGSTSLAGLSKYVVANSLDCGVAFDGDADRCLCVDERGAEVDGDMIMAICALDLSTRGKLNKNTVVGTIMSNFGFAKFCEERNIRFLNTKVGDRYVLEEMSLGGYSFGGEQSGHIIFRDLATTGDGQLTAAMLMSLMKRKGKPLSILSSLMTHLPQTTINVRVNNEDRARFFTDKRISEKINEAERALESSGRVVVRPSGTEPLIRVMVECDSEEETEQIAREIAQTIREALRSK
jgi:phosphoglucosamine mutase